MKAKIKNKKEVAKRTVLPEYDLLGEVVDFKLGQYFFCYSQGGIAASFHYC